MHDPAKIVVFDMDETLGYFVEFGIFWEALNSYLKYENENVTLTQDDFNKVLDLYPEFIRPNIYSILNYLKHKMKDRNFKGVMIYTNNQGPKPWVTFIKNYFENKVKYNIFVRIISAFKINGKQIELCRTTHDKTLKDFIKCSKLPINTQICFLDDAYFPNMKNENVYYIKVKPYIYDLSFDVLTERFIKSDIGSQILGSDHVFNDYMKSYFARFDFSHSNKTKDEYEIDKIVTKKIMIHLQAFFNKKNTDSVVKNKTTGNSKAIKNKTMRNLQVY
jgi:hypothetical protein